MKSVSNNKSYKAMHKLCVVVMLLFLYILLPKNALAQNCANTTPAYTIDFTGKPDSTWTSPSVSRAGLCCGKTGSFDCIVFYVTLDTNSIGIEVDAVGGLGNTDYEINCLNSTPLGSSTCILSKGSFHVTICKPGGNAQQYTIRAIPKPHLVKTEVFVSPGCTAKLQAKGLVTSSITWTSISGAAYNSNLSCTANCTSPVVTPSAGFPAYVDYQVCGTPSSACIASTFCDTVRVYYQPQLNVAINPASAYLCVGAATVNIKASASGGKAPYSYKWNSGETDSSINKGVGTYIVTAQDVLGCQVAKDTVVVTSAPNPAPSIAGSATICEDEFYTYTVTLTANRSYNWSATGGTIVSGANTNTVRVGWGTTGTKTLNVTETNTSTGCFGSASKSITVNARPGPNAIHH